MLGNIGLGGKNLEVTIRERKRIRTKVIDAVRNWAKNLDFPATVILIGSYARGDHNFWSDIDVLIIANTDKKPHRRLDGLDYPPNFEIIFLTPREFLKLLKKGEPFAKEAMTKGIIVRDDLKIKNKYGWLLKKILCD